MHTLVIHMPSFSERWSNVETILHVLPDAHVVDAVEDADGQVSVLPGTLFEPSYPFPLMPEEVGRFLSHRRCWQRIVDEGWDYALVVEDDMGLNLRVIEPLFDLLERNATPDSLIRLPTETRKVQHHVDDCIGGLTLITPRVIGLGSTAQLVGRRAAERLLQASLQIDRPLDRFIQMHWITGQVVQAIQPMVAIELHLPGISVAQTRNDPKRLSEKLSNEWARATYNAAIRARAQKPDYMD